MRGCLWASACKHFTLLLYALYSQECWCAVVAAAISESFFWLLVSWLCTVLSVAVVDKLPKTTKYVPRSKRAPPYTSADEILNN